MMSARLTWLVLGLWLLLTLLLVSIALRAAHFSAREFLLPGRDPLTWIIPSLLILPPLFLAALQRAPSRLAGPSGWALAALLGASIAAIFTFFSPSAYLGG
jgi:hypothetical protein